MADEQLQRNEQAKDDDDLINEASEDANETTPKPSRTHDASQTSPNQLQHDTSSPAQEDQVGNSEILFNSEDADPDTPKGKAEPLPTTSTSKLEQVDSGPTNGDSAAITSPPPSSSDGTNRPAGPRRKLFSWLSRNSTTDAGPKSPPLPGRRGSVVSNDSAFDATSPRPDEDNEATERIARRVHRNSLKDRFKLVRMREEAGIIAIVDVTGPKSELGSQPLGIQGIPALVTVDSDAALQRRDSMQTSTPGPGSPLTQPAINDSLPPGTAAGTLTGPSSTGEAPVDWDLWQEVVYEGPAAVARTSPDELSLATRRGIPSAIRGVVWQVLAQSKNEDLESMYTELVARGNDRERRPSELRARPASTSRPSSTSRPASDIIAPPSSAPILKEEEKEIKTDPENGDTKLTTVDTQTTEESRPALPSPRPSQDVLSVGAVKSEKDMSVAEQQKQRDEAIALEKLERAIKRDLGSRTSFSKFLMSAGLQEGLFGICKAYALFDEEVGYAQGMNFVAMPLLFNMPEEEAFCLFVRLMNHYRLRDLFVADMPGLHLHLYQFERLLEDLEPAVYCHLNRRNVHPQLYATQWFLTLFAYRFPLQLVLRIYDLILSEGLESAILKFGIVLMQKNATKLLEMKDMAALTTFLKERLFDVYIDKSPSASSLLESGFFGTAGGIDKEVYRADALVEDACAAKVTAEMLKTYTAEWEDKVRDEKEKAAAEDALRASNANLTQRVRELESRAQVLDQEHVEIASDLVHTKIANQSLRDDNETLHTRVAELQGIVDAQPAQVEERLRSEMERIMTRNAEVQHENRALEEQGAELESELANVKLKYAELAAELDAMRRKWSSVSTMMSGLGSPSTG